MKIEDIAEICHQANACYCATMGDYSQPDWSDAPAWQRDSAINGVLFHLNNPDAGPEASHENWLHEKLTDGWKHGAVKNPDIKEHPCVLPFADLPREQQAKDHLFRAIVHGLRDFLPTDS